MRARAGAFIRAVSSFVKVTTSDPPRALRPRHTGTRDPCVLPVVAARARAVVPAVPPSSAHRLQTRASAVHSPQTCAAPCGHTRVWLPSYVAIRGGPCAARVPAAATFPAAAQSDATDPSRRARSRTCASDARFLHSRLRGRRSEALRVTRVAPRAPPAAFLGARLTLGGAVLLGSTSLAISR